MAEETSPVKESMADADTPVLNDGGTVCGDNSKSTDHKSQEATTVQTASNSQVNDSGIVANSSKPVTTDESASNSDHDQDEVLAKNVENGDPKKHFAQQQSTESLTLFLESDSERLIGNEDDLSQGLILSSQNAENDRTVSEKSKPNDDLTKKLAFLVSKDQNVDVQALLSKKPTVLKKSSKEDFIILDRGVY